MARGLFGALSSAFRASATRSSSGVPSYGMIPPLGSVQSASGLLISQATAMSVSAVYRAVLIRAQDIARCTPTLVTTAEDGTRTTIKPEEHALAALLKRPNRVQTWFEFMRDLWIAYLLRGNAYAAIKRNRRGDPVELIWINPDAVMVLEASDGSWFYNVNRIGLFQIAMLAEFPTAIPAEDILHFRGISFNMLVGASTIGLARDSIGEAMGQNLQASRWLRNGARPEEFRRPEDFRDERRWTQDRRIRFSAGWGTFLTNDFRDCNPQGGDAFDPVSLVCKLSEVDGRPAVKLSDNYAKALGPQEEIARYRTIFGTEGVSNLPVEA